MRAINRLTAIQIKKAKGPVKLQDGGGLSLTVRESGSKSWVFKYRWGSKRPEIGLGPWPAVSLSDARAKADQARKWLASTPKLDPKAEWVRIAAEEQAESKAIAFGEFALAYIEQRANGWKNRDHKRQWIGSLKRHAAPIWATPINDVTSAEVLQCLKPIWYDIPTTAKRVLGRIELIFDAARAEGYVTNPNPATWRGNLQSVLPKLKRKESHHAAVQLNDVADFWKWLGEREAMSARCLQFLLLTATRSGEARGARWEEFDFDEAVWTVPAKRTKNGDALRIPLSKPALNLLSLVREMPGNIVFPSAVTWEAMTDRALQKICHKSGFSDEDGRTITPHGCRAAFRTWAELNSDEDTAERALGHRRSKLVRAYARGDLLKKRRELMRAWGGFVLGEKESGA